MGKSSAGREARRARADEEAREARIKSGSIDIRKMFDDMFNGQYYNDMKKNIVDHYQPDIDEQFDKTKRKLMLSMMSRGLGDSTVHDNQFGELKYQKGLREQDVLQQAEGAAQGRRSNVLNAEDTVLGQLRSSGDINAANSAASAQLSANSRMPPFSPLGSIFTDFTAGLATQAELERQGNNRYNLGISSLFNNNPNRYTRTVTGKG